MRLAFSLVLFLLAHSALALQFPTGAIYDQSREIQIIADDVTPPDLPPSWDWRNVGGQNWLTSVRNQQGCGNCVAMGLASVVESQMKIGSGLWWWDPKISAQSLFGCGGGKCGSGWVMEIAVQVLKDLGAPDEACSPYQANETCNNCADVDSRRIKIADYKQMSNGAIDPIAVKRALQHGPVWALMLIAPDFGSYQYGVYKRNPEAGPLGPGHTIAIIGYDDKKKAWIVKNSWGEQWGTKGYGMIHYEDTSGLGTLTYSLTMPQDQNYVSMQGLSEGDILDGSKSLQMIGNRKDITGFTLAVEKSDGTKIDQLSCVGAPCEITLDTSKYPDGSYIFRPVAQTTSQIVDGWVTAAKIQNQKVPPTVAPLKIESKILSGQVKWKLQTPFVANELSVQVFNTNKQLVLKREIKNLPEKFQFLWDTRTLPNGIYKLMLTYRAVSPTKNISETQSQFIQITN